MKLIRAKIRQSMVRYALPEALGILLGVLVAYVVHALTHSLVAIAIGGTVGETVGFYSVIIVREVIRYLRIHRNTSLYARIRMSIIHTLRDVVIEFGAAEVLDSLIVRPGLLYIGLRVLDGNIVLGLPIAKIFADCIFLVVATLGHETRKKLFP